MATGAYDANGIWQYGEDDNIALFSDLLKLGTESTSDAFTADRARLATLEAGSLAGLIPVAPTSVVVASGSATVNDMGVVTFTSAGTITLNGVFTSDYANYKILMWDTRTSTSTAVTLAYRLRSSGTDLTTGYNWSRMGYIGTGTDSNAGTGQSYAVLFNIVNHGTGASFNMDVTNPYTTSTIKTSSAVGRANVTGTGAYISTSANEIATQFDGISFFVTSTLFTGKLQVFGYND